ncbi:protein kinase domain-containing protein [Pseudidiomarina sp.]|uniref:protein kinase domain-containing protein n=1 Tax=Pseudidiomarina sp. TaxID=2081707 RepID=UPI00299D450C|nr:protein kinase [Pseudidiomarina sp.]MDX1705930.1 protein kinase [Pseudidiomarina sp.]
MAESELELTFASLSEAGAKATNEDAAAVYWPDSGHILRHKGACFVLADGVSTAEAGQTASALAVKNFIQDYPQTPDSWSVNHSAQQVVATINTQLYQLSHQFQHEQKGYLCTFTALVLKSQSAYFFHAGDSRAYHWRDGLLTQLSHDHTTIISEQRQFLGRALGMDSKVALQSGSVAIKPGDRFLLSSDGIHDFISETRLQQLISQECPPAQVCAELKAEALANGSQDNLSAILVAVQGVPEQSLDDYSQQLVRLPFPPALSAGMKIDGLRVVREIFASSRSHLYLVEDEASGQQLILKCPSINYEDDVLYIDRFIREEWIGLRIRSPHVVRVVRQQRERHYLYYLMEYIEGETLEHWFARQPKPLKPSVAIGLVKQVAAGVAAFHRQGAVHQDLKPGNMMMDKDGTLKIVDFGSVYVAGLAEIYSPLQQDIALGTIDYSDPNYILGHNSGEQGDIYSVATIAYELFTGHLPYGDAIENCTTARDFDKLRYRSASHYNGVIPAWFDRALRRGVSLNLNERYQSLQQLLKDLQQPNPDFLHEEVKQEHKTSSLLFWQLLSGFWFITLILVIWLFLLRR